MLMVMRTERNDSMAEKVQGNEYRNTIVCVDSYEGHVLRGFFSNIFVPEKVTFNSTIEFLKAMEDMLEDMKLPQSYTVVRGFSKKAEEPQMSPPIEWADSGKVATFTIRIMFRQNSSWQGSVRWIEGKVEQSFRSVLELLFLMDSGINGNK